MPDKESSRLSFVPFAFLPTIETKLTCQGRENRTSKSDFAEISQAHLRRIWDAASLSRLSLLSDVAAY